MSPPSNSHPRSRPPFSSLPLDPTGPPGNAWGLYGPDDQLGTLNLLTRTTTLLAAQEIRTGQRLSLDWSLNLPSHPGFNRPPLKWRLHNKTHPDGTPRFVNDDFLDFNTQGGSQWDGLRHYGYQAAKQYYGGRTQASLESGDVLGIARMVEAGGIVTRGVVLDYPRYLERKGRGEVVALESGGISAAELREMLEESGVQTREGDLLLLRTGFTRDYAKLGEQERREFATKPPAFLGVESDKEVLEWIWECGFAAVASDAPSFERAPLTSPTPSSSDPNPHWSTALPSGGLIHQVLLAGWGLPIGELWDLEELCSVAAAAAEGEKGEEKGKGERRATCWVSSVPLKVPGGVASPPNAVAVL